MAAAGYMTEADFESIWDTTITTARFALINVRLGEILNYLITGDASTDTTDTKVLPIYEQISEEALMNILQASKSNKFSDVWQFIQTNAVRVMAKVLWDNKKIMDMLGISLTKRYHYTESANLAFPTEITSLSKRTTS
jgi:hypothetical protein